MELDVFKPARSKPSLTIGARADRKVHRRCNRTTQQTEQSVSISVHGYA